MLIGSGRCLHNFKTGIPCHFEAIGMAEAAGDHAIDEALANRTNTGRRLGT